MSAQKPRILNQKTVAKTDIFEIESVDLAFKNGAERTYERACANAPHAVLIVAVNKARECLLVREYGVGVDQVVLAFPKGAVDSGESCADAAARECAEEVGMAPAALTPLATLAASPGYVNVLTHLYLAENLSAVSISGDEPEPLTVVPWPLDQLADLLNDPSFIDARSVAAVLYIMRHYHVTNF